MWTSVPKNCYKLINFNLCFSAQHKMKNLVWTKGTSGLEGEFQSASEVDFYIDKVSASVEAISSLMLRGFFFKQSVNYINCFFSFLHWTYMYSTFTKHLWLLVDEMSIAMAIFFLKMGSREGLSQFEWLCFSTLYCLYI